MDLTAELSAPCAPAELFTWVAELDCYPRWLEIVSRAVPANSPPGPGEIGPAWTVDLRGRLGPLARTKRLRMVRTAYEPPQFARFERAELDGRRHSSWRLEAEVTPEPPREARDFDSSESLLVMRLHYGGSLWGPVLERMLGDEVERSRPRLLACVSKAAPHG